MQTFLPYDSFKKSAECLDNKRLGKQRVECIQILKALLSPETSGWKNHPAVKMWKGYESSLLMYGLAVCNEWLSRGYNDTCFDKLVNLGDKHLLINSKNNRNLILFVNVKHPKWLGDKKFHASHRSNLLRKNVKWYKQFSWKESDDMPYVWPV